MLSIRRNASQRIHRRFSMTENFKTSMQQNPITWWLCGSTAAIATTITFGAIAPLTRSGASMLYYKPRSFFRPKTEYEWNEEFAMYRELLERNLDQKHAMSMQTFKEMYNKEYLHRMLGQLSTAIFLGPMGYFMYKNQIPSRLYPHLGVIVGIGAVQWFLGRSSIQRSLEETRGTPHKRPTGIVPPFGLTEHSLFSMAKFGFLLWAALDSTSNAHLSNLRNTIPSHALKEITAVRRYVMGATGLFLATATVGTVVASINGGKVYNTFPKMGKKWVPDEILELKPTIRNFFENPAMVQLKHRILAVSTLAAYTALYVRARKPLVWNHMPQEAHRAFTAMMAAVGGQIVFGITMLVNAVPMGLALVHQSGAALILASSLYTLHTLRFSRPAQRGLSERVLQKVAKGN